MENQITIRELDISVPRRAKRLSSQTLRIIETLRSMNPGRWYAVQIDGKDIYQTMATLRHVIKTHEIDAESMISSDMCCVKINASL